MSGIIAFSALPSDIKVDEEKGILFGVCVITEGEAQGANEGTWIDRITLSQVNSVCQRSPDGIKVKLSQKTEHDGSAGQITGTLKETYLDGIRLRGNIHLLKEDSNFKKIIEMAKKMASQFGLSIVSGKGEHEFETIGGKEFLRILNLSSVDFVESPAATRGLFLSSKSPENAMESKIKYAKGDSGEHDSACECKGCMSKHSKKEMSAWMASMLGLPAEATEAEIQSTFKASRTGDIATLTAKLDAATVKLSALETGSANALALSKKAEIDNLIAEATRLGKVVPLDNDDLYTVKDGICTIKMEPAQLSKMVSKLVPGKIKMSKQPEPAKGADGKVITSRRSDEYKAFAPSKREEGATEMNALFTQMRNQTGLSQTN